MGFKRTSEGRVFFQGADENPAPTATKEATVAPPGAANKKAADYRALTQGPSPQATQFQILSLLKNLNDKLKDGQTERSRMRAELDNYRQLIAELEDKAGKAERAERLAEETAQEMIETRKLLLDLEDKTERADKGVDTLQKQIGLNRAMGEEIVKKQVGYESLLKRLDENETKQDNLSQKLDATVTQQSKMLRQIEKVAEDRTRFMRKIERIEETVIQTRDALNAKAMVLLTEQGTGTVRAEAAPTASATSVVDQVLNRTRNFETWKRPLAQATAIAALLVVAVLSGWLINEIQKYFSAPTETQVESYAGEADTKNETAVEPLKENAGSGTQYVFKPDEPAAEQTAEIENSEAPPQLQDQDETVAPYVAPTEPVKGDDVGAINLNDTAKLEKMLADNPDQLAAQLNEIEPGSAPAKAEPLPATEKPQQLASIAPEPKVEPAPVKEEPVAEKSAPATSQDLHNKLKADRSLPEAVKKIENQAYAGIPEAQHDLAAIYTAGQNGVKQNYERAAFWFRQAADQGIANARYNLGVLYHQGLGVNQDVKEAIRWYTAAAKLNHPEAQYNLGIAYIEGIGVAYDPDKAATNFESAARHGITEAAYNLGLIYENGLLGSPKPAEALKWYKTAADQGSPEAKEALEQLAQTLKVKVEDVNRVADAAAEKPAPATPARPPLSQQALTAQVQDYLIRAGLFPGPADGVGSLQTEDAIRSYQSLNNLKVDGKVSDDLLAHMLSNEAAPTKVQAINQ